MFASRDPIAPIVIFVVVGLLVWAWVKSFEAIFTPLGRRLFKWKRFVLPVQIVTHVLVVLGIGWVLGVRWDWDHWSSVVQYVLIGGMLTYFGLIGPIFEPIKEGMKSKEYDDYLDKTYKRKP